MPESINLGHLILLVLLSTRLVAMMCIAPVYAGRALPVRFRLLLAASIALVVLPLYSSETLGETITPLHFGSLLMSEMAVGLMFGLSTRLLFMAVDLAGLQFANICGSQFPGQDDMTQSGNGPTGRLYSVICLLVFLSIGGHRKLMSGLLDSFRYAPPGEDHLSRDWLPLLIQMLSSSFEFAIRLGAPIVIASLLALLLLGIASRSLPQFNLMQNSFTISTLITLVVMIASIGTVQGLVESQHERMHAWVADWLEQSRVVSQNSH
jgi:flagellar biosynthetic protein FliR